MVSVQEIIGPRVRAMRLTPIVVHAQESAVIDNRQSIRLRNRNNIHHPHGLRRQSSRKPAQTIPSATSASCKSRVKGEIPCLPSVASLHVHHIADGAPVDAQSLQIRLLDDALPVLRVGSILFCEVPSVDSLLCVAQPRWGGIYSLRPLFWPARCSRPLNLVYA